MEWASNIVFCDQALHDPLSFPFIGGKCYSQMRWSLSVTPHLFQLRSCEFVIIGFMLSYMWKIFMFGLVLFSFSCTLIYLFQVGSFMAQYF